MKEKGEWKTSFVREVFRVLCSPLKAFEEIVKKPDVKGPLLILALIIGATLFAQYVSASKLFLEIGTPDKDDWTESISHWNTLENGTLSIDADCWVGNYSVKSFVSNGTSIWMNKTDIGQLNCSGDAGYKALSFRIKWIHQNEAFPTNATLQLFSNNGSSYFKLDLVDRLNSSNVWANVTVNVGSDSPDWRQVDSPNWENITGLEFRLAWLASDAANLTMKIDDLYFGKYVSYLTTGLFTEWAISSLIGTVLDFFLRWIIFAGVILVMIKAFRSETGPWGLLLIVIGYTFSTRIIYVPVYAFLIYLLPPLNFPLKAWKPVEGEEEIASALVNEIYRNNWYPNLAYITSGFLTLAVHLWMMALSAIALRFLREFSWWKVSTISGFSYIISVFLRALILL